MENTKDHEDKIKKQKEEVARLQEKVATPAVPNTAPGVTEGTNTNSADPQVENATVTANQEKSQKTKEALNNLEKSLDDELKTSNELSEQLGILEKDPNNAQAAKATEESLKKQVVNDVRTSQAAAAVQENEVPGIFSDEDSRLLKDLQTEDELINKLNTDLTTKD